MLRSIGPGRSRRPARHRLGAPGLVHCRVHPEVNGALASSEHTVRLRLRVPACRSWAMLRRRVGRRVISLRQALSLG